MTTSNGNFMLLLVGVAVLFSTATADANSKYLRADANVAGTIVNNPAGSATGLHNTNDGKHEFVTKYKNKEVEYRVLLTNSDHGVLRDERSGATLKLKADVLYGANNKFHFQTLSGQVEGVSPSKLIRGAVPVKPLKMDFALAPQKKSASGKPLSEVEPRDLHRGGEVDVLLSSDYLDALFGYNYGAARDDHNKHDTHGHDHGKDGHKHEVHEFDSVSIPATFRYEGIRLSNKGSDNVEDGDKVTVVLTGLSIKLRPRVDHIQRGVSRSFYVAFYGTSTGNAVGDVATGGALVLTGHALRVPAQDFNGGKWILRPFYRDWWRRFQLKRRICVQPVRVAQRRCKFALPSWLGGFCFWWRTTSVSGRGLAFGRPGADEQWGKVDITFDWQPWKTVIDRTGKYESLTSGAEETDLKNKVDDDNCVEVFFVEHFDPIGRMGGGACWGGGTAGTKIITTDENVDCGTDITHLAHELGHALNLKHPGSGHATRPDGTPGTLLCASGWEQDNPRRQSEENGDNASNPLLTTYLTFVGWWGGSAGPDCTDSSDCGSCNAHLPNEPCS